MGRGPDGEKEEAGEERSLCRERKEGEGEIRLIDLGGRRWSFVEVRWRYGSGCGIGLEIVGRSEGFCGLEKGLTKAKRDAESFDDASPRSAVLGRMRGAIVTCQS